MNESFENHSTETLQAYLKDAQKRRPGRIAGFKQYLVKRELEKRSKNLTST